VNEPEVDDEQNRTDRFSLQTMLLCTIAWGLLLAYANTTGRHGPVQASLFLLFGGVAGLATGLFGGKFIERLFWASLISTVAFLAVAGGSLKDPGVLYGWGFVGAIWGALFPNKKPQLLLIRSVMMAAIGGAGMLCSCLTVNRMVLQEDWFDIFVASFIGFSLGPVSRTAIILEGRGKGLKIALVVCLVFSVLVGNWLVPIMGGGTR